MKTLCALALAVTALISPCINSQPPGPHGIPGHWELTLNDGPKQIGRWESVLQPPNNWLYEPQVGCYDPANRHIGVYYAYFWVTRHVCAGQPDRPYTGVLADNGNLFRQRYGAFEVRAYVSDDGHGGLADWPAFWLYGGPPWPSHGEIDVLEAIGGAATGNIHYGSPTAIHNPIFSVPMRGGWHTFGVWWQPASVRWYYDGRLVGQIQETVLHYPMHMILDNTVSIWGHTVVPSRFAIAYVRAWRNP